MGLWSGICDFASSTVSAVCSVVKNAVIPVARALAPVLTKVPGAIGVIARVATMVFAVLDIFKPDEGVEEVGDRAIQAEEAGINRDRFENHDEYMEALRDFDLDPQRSEEITADEKLVVGLAIGGLGLEEKYKVNMEGMAQVWGLVAKNPTYFNADRIQALVEKGVDMKAVADNFQGKLGPTQSDNLEKTLLDIDRKLSPEFSDRDLYTQMDQVRDGV